MKISRRTFLAYSGGTVLTLYGFDGSGVPKALAAVPGGTLNPTTIPKYVQPLVIPPKMMPSPGTDTYNIGLRQFQQQILPAPLGKTAVWSYGPGEPPGTPTGDGTDGYFYPAFTIEATRGTTTEVAWRNQLGDAPHLLPVDPWLHWANPFGKKDSRPDPNLAATQPPASMIDANGSYIGPVPMITHVHGHEHVEDWSDGYAEAWYLSEGLPNDKYRTGTWYNFFQGKASAAPTTWGQGYATFKYPNTQRPTTLWYHDHTLGMTRVNVYAGPAGFYIIRSADPGDEPQGVLPGGLTDYYNDSTIVPHELPIVIQDRSFGVTPGGTELFYPNTRAFFDGFAGPYVPDVVPATGLVSDVMPIWNPEFFGNVMVVNGQSWPFHNVEPRRYRIRFLNGCNSRFLILRFDDPKVDMWQIGNEGGYLRAPVNAKSLLLAPAERADVIVDFGRIKPGKSVRLLNDGPDAPFGGGGFRRADARTTGQVMQFNVQPVPATFVDPTTPPAQLVLPAQIPNLNANPPELDRTTPQHVRYLSLNEIMSANAAIPVEALLGTHDDLAGVPAPLHWMEPETEKPEVGTVEDWVLYNFTADAHPIHVHEVLFMLVGRQALDPKTNLRTGPINPPNPTEDGWKETVIAYPGEATILRVDFRNAKQGQFVWHCHIVEHEDNEMMRPYRIGAIQTGAPNDPNPA